MEFKKYSSIKTIKDIGRVDSIAKVNSVATEKVHGMNASLYYDGTVRYAMRNEFNDHAFETVRDYTEECRRLAEFYECKELIVYGEVFGGSYAGEITDGARKILKGNDYIPFNDFIVFDVMADGEMQVFRPDIWRAVGFKVVPVIKYGPYHELMKLDPSGKTSVSSMYGLDDIGRREGLVVKTVAPMYRPDGLRYINKLISPAFKPRKGPTVRTKPVDIPERLMETYQAIRSEINEIRLENALSKLPGEHAIHKVAGIMMQDILEDFDITKKDWNSIKKMPIEEAIELTREYMLSE